MAALGAPAAQQCQPKPRHYAAMSFTAAQFCPNLVRMPAQRRWHGKTLIKEMMIVHGNYCILFDCYSHSYLH